MVKLYDFDSLAEKKKQLQWKSNYFWKDGEKFIVKTDFIGTLREAVFAFN